MLALVASLLLLLPTQPTLSVKTVSASTQLSQSLSALAALNSQVDRDGNADDDERHECRVKNMKQDQRMSRAKLAAHRCLVRDTVVEVPLPKDLIVNYVHPSHVVIPRCTGKNQVRVIPRLVMYSISILTA